MNNSFLYDLRFGFRLIRRSPFATTLAVFCLACGIGLSTFMFSIAYAVVGRGLPYEDQERIIHISRQNIVQISDPTTLIHMDEYRTILEQQTSFKQMAAMIGDGVTVGRAGFPHRMSGIYVTPSFFEIMPVSPMLGRLFTEDDATPSTGRVLILGNKVWRDHFASDPDVIGSQCICEGQPFTVIGVMPPGYDLPFKDDVWMPLVPETIKAQTGWIDFVTMVGRLEDGHSLKDARAEFAVIFDRIDRSQGVSELIHAEPKLEPLFNDFVGPEIRLLLWSMFGATFLVLLIACSNVSSLLTARLVVRSNELAIRSALGANRKRIMAQILTEAVLYGLIGAAIGLLLAAKALSYLWEFVSSRRFSPPEFMEWSLDPMSIVVAVSLMILAVLVSAILPSLRASRPNISALLNDSQRTGSSVRLGRLSSLSTIMQLAFSFALLVAAGRLIAAIVMLTALDYPINEKGLLVGSLAIDNESYPEVEDEVRFWEDVHREVRRIPGARTVGLGFNLPCVWSMQDPIRIPGVDYAVEADYPVVRVDVITPGYFEALEVELIDGRDFDNRDIRGKQNVAIINSVMAEKFWPNENPLGKIFYMQGKGDYQSDEQRMHRIIGVVPDLKMAGLVNDEDDGAGFYRPQGQALWGDLKIFLRTDSNPSLLIPEVQKAISLIDPNVAFTEAMTFEEHVSDNNFYFRFFLGLFTTFGGMALLLAAAGVYGIIQYSVSQRVVEFGIRMAIGATPAHIRWMVLWRGLRNTVIGLILGGLISIALVRVLSIAFEGLPTEFYSFFGALAVLFVISLIANGFPARRASKLDPMVALRVQ
ncbi:MAG TPA: ABC transporter permease [Oceanipulchritudo sp.]|nr:ABC transporter permease [Oceanipulchritudo sp.]